MTNYIVEILKQLGIDYRDYNIQNHWDDESGETWITLHPKEDWREAEGLGRIRKLSQAAFGKYKIYWDEDSCYLNIVGVLEINSKGEQVFPLPVDKPALFSQEYILKTWRENRTYLYL